MDAGAVVVWVFVVGSFGFVVVLPENSEFASFCLARCSGVIIGFFCFMSAGVTNAGWGAGYG